MRHEGPAHLATERGHGAARLVGKWIRVRQGVGRQLSVVYQGAVQLEGPTTPRVVWEPIRPVGAPFLVAILLEIDERWVKVVVDGLRVCRICPTTASNVADSGAFVACADNGKCWIS